MRRIEVTVTQSPTNAKAIIDAAITQPSRRGHAVGPVTCAWSRAALFQLLRQDFWSRLICGWDLLAVVEEFDGVGDVEGFD